MSETLIEPDTPISNIFRLSPAHVRGLKKLRLHTARDLLYYFPTRYGDPLVKKSIAELNRGDKAIIVAQVVSSKISKAWKKKIPISEVVLADESGEIKAIWFHQAYMAKKVPEGQWARVSGTVQSRKGELYFANPEISHTSPNLEAQGGSLFSDGTDSPLMPIYSETSGVSSLWIHHAIERLLRASAHKNISDPIPEHILTKYNLPALSSALIWIHAPKNPSNSASARKRFAFEEIFAIQLGRHMSRASYGKTKAHSIKTNKEILDRFLSRLPFKLTASQENAVKIALRDIKSSTPMMRLVEGDVGSGKTAVAAAAAYTAVASGFGVAYMAPTEILAKQHFESFISHFKEDDTCVGLITGTECRKFPSKIYNEKHTKISRSQFLKWVKSGEIPIVIGTHALIQKTVEFKKLSLVIIDEQHRFGVNQRLTLARKRKDGEPNPHLLSMTATPIPRTLALTLYGDLDITLLTEMPPGRKVPITQIVQENERHKMYEKVRDEIRAGRQAYVICPRIDEPDPEKELAMESKSVKEESARLAKEDLRGFSIGVLHGKMKPAEKEEVMSDFLAGKMQVLCATSVVEVGVNVPNATVIIIEGAERFGLAQLHQLRGRVMRSTHQAYCFALTSTPQKNISDRLKSFSEAQNGFELAERDLEIRGSGELSGIKQWGITDVGMDAIKNMKMVEAAREEAKTILDSDPKLKLYPELSKIAAKFGEIHFE